MGFPGGSESTESACDASNLGLIPGLGRDSPWTEEPGGLWSMGSQRVGHD